ncbi:MAG: MerR family transcriptional regulator [Pseudomonadota bacterium]
MTQRIAEYSVGQLARLSGVSVRTLHHYHAIGLLPPAGIAANGYRLYREAELLRLQEILFYREIGLPLAEIAALLQGPDTTLSRLLRHRARLEAEARKTSALLATLDTTIAHLKGEKTMAHEDLYTPFSSEKQAEYEAWLVETYREGMKRQIAEAKVAMAARPDGMEKSMRKLRDIETSLVTAFEAGTPAEATALHAPLERHRALMGDFWGKPCGAEGFAGLADLYLSHPDFVARYEALSPAFSAWLPRAMKAHAARLTEAPNQNK